MTSDAAPPVKSVEKYVYEGLREGIVQGTYPPSTSLQLEPLAREFGVSTTPVRAALRRLEAEGLTISETYRGTIVAPLDLNDFEEIQTIRCALEGYAARLGATQVTSQGIEMMTESLRRLHITDTVIGYLAEEWVGYSYCYEAAGSSELLQLIAHYRRRAERYIRIAVKSTPFFGDAHLYQGRLIDACKTRDGQEAERVIRESIDWTGPRIAQTETFRRAS